MDSLGFFSERMTRAYQEQVWAVALLGGIDGFIVSNGSELSRVINPWISIASVSLLALFALFFVGIRHATYACYYTLANGELVRKDPSIETKLPGAVSPNRTFIARWSGVSFYSLLILGLSLLAVMMLWKG
jgi:hypothetical protein